MAGLGPRGSPNAISNPAQLICRCSLPHCVICVEIAAGPRSHFLRPPGLVLDSVRGHAVGQLPLLKLLLWGSGRARLDHP